MSELGPTAACATTLRVTPRGSVVPFEYWFDAETHLPMRVVETAGPVTTTTRYADYRDLEGLRVAFSETSRSSLNNATAQILDRFRRNPDDLRRARPQAPIDGRTTSASQTEPKRASRSTSSITASTSTSCSTVSDRTASCSTPVAGTSSIPPLHMRSPRRLPAPYRSPRRPSDGAACFSPSRRYIAAGETDADFVR